MTRFLGLWTHVLAILFLVIAPASTFVADKPVGQVAYVIVLSIAALFVAELHAGLFDEMFNDLQEYSE